MRTGDARADAPSGAGRCAAGRHKDKALASLSERLKGSACGRGRGGLPTGQGRGIAPLCGVGMNPHFLFGCAEKKTAVHGQKKRRFRVQILPMRAGLDKYGGRASRCPRKPRVPYRVRYPLGEQRGCCPAFGGVGAAFGVVIKGLYHWPRAYLRLRAALTGGWLRYAPAGAAASLRATQEVAGATAEREAGQVGFAARCTAAVRRGLHACKFQQNRGTPRNPSEAVFVGRGRASE